MAIIVAPLALVLLIAGITLLVRGLRGNTIDDHPVCRRCRFDLVGLPKTSGQCSECGADLSSPRAVRIGNRSRRPVMIFAGVALLLPSVATLVLVALVAFSNIAWIEHAPHWYLMRQAGSPVAAVRDPALAELARRLAASDLSDRQVAATVDAGLALQADQSATWIPEWGDLIESARRAGKVPDETWRRYLTGTPVVALAVRPEVRRGEKLVVRVNELPARSGTHSRLQARIGYEVLPDSDLVKPRRGGSITSHLGPTGGGSIGSSYDLLAGAAADADGPKTLHIQVHVNVYDGGSSASESRPPDATATFDLRAPWALVPTDAATVRAIDDPAARPAVERGIRVQEVSFHGSPTHVQVHVQFDRLPVPVAYRVVLRAGGREWDAGQVSAPPNIATGWSAGGEVRDLTANRVDVVLRPDPAVAAATVDLHDYWNGEIVIRDVPVARPAAKQ